jgi:hypothetical protein
VRYTPVSTPVLFSSWYNKTSSNESYFGGAKEFIEEGSSAVLAAITKLHTCTLQKHMRTALQRERINKSLRVTRLYVFLFEMLRGRHRVCRGSNEPASQILTIPEYGGFHVAVCAHCSEESHPTTPRTFDKGSTTYIDNIANCDYYTIEEVRTSYGCTSYIVQVK